MHTLNTCANSKAVMVHLAISDDNTHPSVVGIQHINVPRQISAKLKQEVYIESVQKYVLLLSTRPGSLYPVVL